MTQLQQFFLILKITVNKQFYYYFSIYLAGLITNYKLPTIVIETQNVIHLSVIIFNAQYVVALPVFITSKDKTVASY